LRSIICSAVSETLIHKTVEELWENWVRHADFILADEELLETVYHALQRRHQRSRSRGRPGTAAEVVLRMRCSSTAAIGALSCWSAKFVATCCIGSLLA
jgi:hypothetical protein